jgi:hypothetical protein
MRVHGQPLPLRLRLVLLLCGAGQLPRTAGDARSTAEQLLATTRGWTSGRVPTAPAAQVARMHTVLRELGELEQSASAAELEADTRSRVTDSCEYLAHKLGEKDLAVEYAMKMAADPVCQDRQQSGDCFKEMASKALCRLHELRRSEEATAYFDQIVALRSPRGLRLAPWPSEWQTPAFYYPDGRRLDLFPDSPGQLRGKPWWDAGPDEPASLAEAREQTEANFAQMQAEVVRLLSEAGAWQLEGDHDAVQSGAWTEYMLYSRSDDSDTPTWNDARCARVPTICRVFSRLAGVAGTVNGIGQDGQPRPLVQGPGQVTILRMAPGTRLEAHCGPQNSRLTAHLPLVVPSVAGLPAGEAGLRIGPPGEDGEFEWRVWEEGKLMIFDDSFEHESRWPEPTAEATVGGGAARYVVYASLWHPDAGTPTTPSPEQQWDGTATRPRQKAGKGSSRRKRAAAHQEEKQQAAAAAAAAAATGTAGKGHSSSSDSGSGSSKSDATEAAAARDSIREKIEELYAKHNPEKLDSVPQLMAKYKGMEQELLDSIKEKYRVVAAVEIDMDDL